MAYAGKDTIDEMFRRDGMYGRDPGPGTKPPVKPARTGEPVLHPAERQIRDEFAADLDRQADLPGLEPNIARAMRARAGKIRNAMPILDFKRAMAAYNDSLADNTMIGLDAIEYRAGVDEAKANLAADNPYPPDFEYAVDQCLNRGVSPDDIDLYGVTGIPDPNAEKSRPVSKARTYKPGLISRKDGWCPFCDVEVTVAESTRPPHKGGGCEPGSTPMEKAFLRTFR